MTPSAFLLEVVVGELTLTHYPLLHPHHPAASSPTVCIKVEAGPPLLVPFLAPAFPKILGQAGAEDGHYIFQRGKSSVFSSSSNLLGGDKGARVKVEVLACGGGRGGQPAVLGRCDALMLPQGEASTLLGLQGKLVLVGEKGEPVGHVSLSLSLRCLGKVVSTGADWELPRGKERSYTASGVPSTYEKSFDITQDGPYPSFHSIIPHHDFLPSENVDFRIASPQDPRKPLLGDSVSPQHPREEGKCGLTQPPLILFSGPDKEEEKLWDKVTMVRQNKAMQAQEDQHRQTNTGRSDNTSEESQHSGQGSQAPGEGHSHTPTQHHRQKTKVRNTHHPPKTAHRRLPKHLPTYPPLARPQGWLRSTPPAPTAPAPPPRLNRSHLLRLAAANPQLGQNLRAEVDRQVKDRVKRLEAEFLERVEKLTAKRRSRRMSHRAATVASHYLKSVECQTEDVRLTSQLPGGRRHSQEAPSPPVPQSSPPVGHHHHYQAPPTQAHISPPQHPNTNTNKTTATQTGTHRSTASHSPKETKAERKPDTHRNRGTETEAEVAPASSASTGVSGKAQGPSSRIKLGQMPKNVTYVIGPDGERVYGEALEVLPQEEEGERDEAGGGVRSERKVGRRERRVADKKENERNSSILSPSPKPKEKTAPVPSLKGYPRPQPQRREGEEEELLPREPSQDTWGLTYTIRAADHDHSTSLQQRSTPSTHLSTPQTDSEGGGDYGESWESSEVEEVEEEEVEEMEKIVVEEEVSSASSRSVQVFQEIFKGRKAYILSGMATSSPPPQSIGESLLSPPVSRADSEEGRAGQGHSSPAMNLTPSPLPSSPELKISPRSHIKGKSHKQEEYYETDFHWQDSSGDNNLKEAKGSIAGRAQPSGRSTSLRDSASRSAGGTSISDISARIAALLVTRPVSVPRLNTESVSSYIPSEQPGTLSSMTDVLLSPPSPSVSS